MLDTVLLGRGPLSLARGFRTGLGRRLPGVRTEPAGLRRELRFRPTVFWMLNIAAREGSFRLQPPHPPPSAGKSMPAPLG